MPPIKPAWAKGRSKKGGRAKKPENSKKAEPEQKKPDVKGFLELPPEIRNRIYHFAREYPFKSYDLEPPLLFKPKEPRSPHTPSKYGARQFLALTQTCKQIRSEFRPLWLRQSVVRLRMWNVTPFITTYYPKVEEYQNAPGLLFVSWDHGDGEDDDVLVDITLLLRLRSQCPTFTAKFVSHKLAEGDLPNAHCEECGHHLHCGCDIECEHEGALDEVLSELHYEYHYLNAVNEVLDNSNEEWLKSVREHPQGEMKVEFTFDNLSKDATIHIRFLKDRAPALLKKSDMHKSVIRYLRLVGMFDLDWLEDVDFVVGEATGKYTRHSEGCCSPVPTYIQTLVAGRDGKKAVTDLQPASST